MGRPTPVEYGNTGQPMIPEDRLNDRFISALSSTVDGRVAAGVAIEFSEDPPVAAVESDIPSNEVTSSNAFITA
jgi:hypothetical protein